MTRRGKKSGDRVRRGRRRSLFRGRLDGNEEERRNSFELTPLRFKGGDPLSPRSAVCTRYGSRTCIIGPNCFLASVIAIVPLRPGLLLLLLFSFHRNRCVHLSFFLSFFRLVSSPIVPVNFISRIIIGLAPSLCLDRDPR